MRLTTGRLVAVTIGGPLLVCALVAGAFSMVGTFARASEHHEVSYPWSGGGVVSVNVGSGSVHVVVGADNTVGVAYTEYYELKKPTATGVVTASGLTLDGRCPTGLFGSNCNVNYVLTVPASAKLVLHSGNGSIAVADVTGSVSIDTGDGSISLDGVSGAVVAHSGNGSVSGTAMGTASLQASTGNGSVHLAWVTAPTAAVTTSGNGSIHLTVPTGSGPYQVQATTGNGSRHVNVPVNSTAAETISAHSGNGSVTIDTAG